MTNKFAQIKASKKIKFMTVEVEISKLSVARVLEIQAQAKEIENSKEESDNLKLLLLVIRAGASEMADLSDEELFDLPMDDLSNLSNEIMKYSGLGK
jgi:hypothetical protein